MLFSNLVPSCPPFWPPWKGVLFQPHGPSCSSWNVPAHANGLRASARVTLSLDSLMAHYFASLMSLPVHHPFFKNLFLVTFYEIATHPTWCPLALLYCFIALIISNRVRDQSWVFIGRTDAEAETPILWPLHAKSWLIGKDSDAGRDWGQEEKGTAEDEMGGWYHWLNGHEFEWAPGVGDGQGGLACCDSWGRKESDMTEQLNWTELIAYLFIIMYLFWLLFIACYSWTKALCRNGSLFSPLMYLTFLAQFLAQFLSLYSVNICWMDMRWPLWPF